MTVEYNECSTCEGQGALEIIDPDYGGTGRFARCDRCEGLGEVRVDSCPSCWLPDAACQCHSPYWSEEYEEAGLRKAGVK